MVQEGEIGDSVWGMLGLRCFFKFYFFCNSFPQIVIHFPLCSLNESSQTQIPLGARWVTGMNELEKVKQAVSERDSEWWRLQWPVENTTHKRGGGGGCISACVDSIFQEKQKKNHDFNVYCCYLVAKTCLTVFQPHGLFSHQSPLSMGLPRQEYWSGLPFSFQGIFAMPGLNLRFLH